MGDHPWKKWAGVWKNNPDFEEYLSNIAEYRRRAEVVELQKETGCWPGSEAQNDSPEISDDADSRR